MPDRFLGLPIPLWGYICLLLAIFYAFKWPKLALTTRPRSKFEKFIIRWGHALCWLLLSLGAFFWAAEFIPLAMALAISGSVLYLFFMVVVSAGLPRPVKKK